MIIPNKLKIGGHVYKVVREDAMSDEEALFGHCVTRKLQIYIDSRPAQSQQEETLIHEVMHAICRQISAFPRDEAGSEMEERVVQGLGHGMYQFLKENNFII